MSNPLVPPTSFPAAVGAIRSAGLTARDTVGATGAAFGAALPGPGPGSATETAAHALPNPTLRLDPALGLVVIEFRDAAGDIAHSIPSNAQIAAYRQWIDTRQGHNPLNGATAGAASGAADASTAGATAVAETSPKRRD